MYCKKCGKQIPDNSKFCPECGSSLEENNNVKTMHLKCSNCGADMEVNEETNEVYCSYCGTKQLILDPELIKARNSKEIELEKIKSEERKQTRKDKADELKSYRKGKLSKFTIITAVLCLIFGFMAFKSRHYLSGIIAIIQIALFSVSWLSGMQIIKPRIKNIHIALSALAFILIIPFFFANNIKVYEKLDWPGSGIAQVLPDPKQKHGEVSTYNNDRMYATIYKTEQKDYEKYLDKCIDSGFIIEAKTSSYSYEAFNEEGYKLDLTLYSDFYTIALDAPIEAKEFTWPQSELVKLLPVPSSNKGIINYEYETSFSIDIAETPYEEYVSYVDKVMEKGFTTDYSKTDNSFHAFDSAGNEVKLSYKGFNTMQVLIYKAEEPETVIEENKSETKEENTVTDNNTVDPDLKKFLDEYEAFIDDYIAFMTKYNESENTAELMSDYFKMISRYGAMEESLNKYDEENMSPADEAYYIEVLARCNAKLYNASIS
ncbi:MAG: DUF6591 domain-containing protein [Erysipelotrichaceae bacterium]